MASLEYNEDYGAAVIEFKRDRAQASLNLLRTGPATFYRSEYVQPQGEIGEPAPPAFACYQEVGTGVFLAPDPLCVLLIAQRLDVDAIQSFHTTCPDIQSIDPIYANPPAQSRIPSELFAALQTGIVAVAAVTNYTFGPATAVLLSKPLKRFQYHNPLGLYGLVNDVFIARSTEFTPPPRPPPPSEGGWTAQMQTDYDQWVAVLIEADPALLPDRLFDNETIMVELWRLAFQIRPLSPDTVGNQFEFLCSRHALLIQIPDVVKESANFADMVENVADFEYDS